MLKFEINSQTVAHMVTQIRAKQLVIQDSQYKVQKSIVEGWEEKEQDISGENSSKEIKDNLKKFYDTSKSINEYLKEQKVEDIGFPIKFNKTALQLKMTHEWAMEQDDNLIAQIKNGKFYHSLSNNISKELPILQSDNETSFWGNENSSVSSVLLESISTALDIETKPLTGTATFYPFYNEAYSLPKNFVPENYPFVNKNGMLLFGDYQFGGHRYFNDQLLFGPEDCSSSIGKATYLSTEQIKNITTSEMRENPSNFGYELVATLNNVNQEQLNLIEAGDIYLYKNHTAIIATKPDNYSNITTLQFARDIDRAEQKLLGGGVYDYNLIDKLSEDQEAPIYILRPENLKPLNESASLQDSINAIDTAYLEMYPEGPFKNILGDCRIFIEDEI